MFDFSELVNAADDSIFEEIPVSVREFCSNPNYMNLPTLSDYQILMIEMATQIYNQDTLYDIMPPAEAKKRWAQTKRESIYQLGKGCMTADSEVYNADNGQWERIADLQMSTSGYSAGVSDGQIKPEFRTEAFITGHRPVYKVKTRRGLELTVNASHKFVTKDGLRELMELSTGDEIATAAKLPIANPVPMDDREVELLAIWLGDGMMPAEHNRAFNVDFSEYETETLNRYLEICRSYGDEPTVRKHPAKKMYFVRHGVNSPLHAIVEKHGLFGARASTKSIPKAIFSLPDEQVALFLSRLHGTDGCFYIKKCGSKRNPAIEFCSISEQLVSGYVRLLARLGVVASVRSRIPKYTYKGEVRTGQRAFYACISHREGYLRFAEQIKMLDKQHMLEKGRELAESMRNTEKRYDGDIYWDTIKSIEEVGSEDLFTITASETHNYVANLILNGNSGK